MILTKNDDEYHNTTKIKPNYHIVGGYMPNITVKNIPDRAYETLKQIAASHHRSINSEIVYLIEKATTSHPFSPEQHLSFARQIRNKTKKFLLTENIVNSAKSEGRS